MNNKLHAITGNKSGSYADALLLEKQGELKTASALYVILHRKAPKNLKILNRLIIISRKLKDVTGELKYIDTAIKIHEQYYSSRKPADKKTLAISKKLNLLLGHTDKKGKAVFKPAELQKLELRKQRLQSPEKILRKK